MTNDKNPMPPRALRTLSRALRRIKRDQAKRCPDCGGALIEGEYVDRCPICGTSILRKNDPAA